MVGKLHTLMAGALVAPALIAAGVSPLAHGQTVAGDPRTSVVLVDARGDVDKFFPRKLGRRDPREHRSDIARVRVAHNPNVVVVRTELYRLHPGGIQHLWMKLRTNEGRHRTVFLQDSGFMHVGVGSHQCDAPGNSRRIDYADNVMTVHIARSCLGDPRWIRAHVFTIFIPESRSTHYTLEDNAHSDGQVGSGGWTPRLRHG